MSAASNPQSRAIDTEAVEVAEGAEGEGFASEVFLRHALHIFRSDCFDFSMISAGEIRRP